MKEGSTSKGEGFEFDKHYFAVAVSDVHLGFNFEDNDFPDPANTFREFIQNLNESETSIDNFVILGDFLDFWRRDDGKLFADYGDILNTLVDMKNKSKRIKELYYLPGNHDYNIIWYKRYKQIIRFFFRQEWDWLKQFKVKSGSVVKFDPLILKKADKTYVFRHGHQDQYHSAGPLYNFVCILLGTSDDTTGRFASNIWKYKFYLPLAVASGTLFYLIYLMALSSHWLLAGVIGAIALGFLSAVYWRIKTKKADEVKITEKLKDKRDELKKLKKDELDSEINGLFENLGQPKPKDPDEILFLGHTHHMKVEDGRYNLGAWVEKSDCRILAITTEGDVKMYTWPPYDESLQDV
ncbi:MAG: metallophosphoesterase [Candidatus Thorarchaeota archaeon]